MNWFDEPFQFSWEWAHRVFPVTWVGLIGAGAMLLVAALLVLYARLRWRDHYYAGVIPGELPTPGTPVRIIRKRPGIVPEQVIPPEGLEPAEASVLLTGRVGDKAVMATILSLVVDRFVSLDISRYPTRLVRNKAPASGWGKKIEGFQAAMLRVLGVGGADEVRFDGQPQSAGLVKRMADESANLVRRVVMEKGFFDMRPLRLRAAMRRIGTVAIVAGTGTGVIGSLGRGLLDGLNFKVSALLLAMVIMAGFAILWARHFHVGGRTIALTILVVPVYYGASIVVGLYLLLVQFFESYGPWVGFLLRLAVSLIVVYVLMAGLVGPVCASLMPMRSAVFTAFVSVPAIIYATAAVGALGLWPVSVAAVGGGCLLLWAGSGRPRYTAQGSATWLKLMGFKKYLATAEAGQLSWEAPQDVYAQYLPWAVVLGVESQWSAAMKEFTQANAVTSANIDNFVGAEPLSLPISSVDDLARASLDMWRGGRAGQRFLDGVGRRRSPSQPSAA